MKRAVGDGFGNQPIIYSVQGLYEVREQKNHFISQMGLNDNTGWDWRFVWRRLLFQREEELKENMLVELQRTSITSGREDAWIWSGVCHDGFSVQEAYRSIKNWELEEESEILRKIWDLVIPSKVAVVIWTIFQEEL